MAQVTIYMNRDLEAQIKGMASALNLSISKFISNTLEEKVHNEWNPRAKELAGSWSDFPTLAEIRQSHTKDIKREEF